MSKPFGLAMFDEALRAFPREWQCLRLSVDPARPNRALLITGRADFPYLAIEYGAQTMPVQTITGTRNVPIYSIHYPQWDREDECYVLDEDLDAPALGYPQETAPNWIECLIQIAQWMLREAMLPALSSWWGAGEYEYWLESKEEEEILQQSREEV